MSRNLVVIGQGYVGLPLAMRASEVGFSVEALESDLERAERLNQGHSYISGVSDEELQTALKRGYRAGDDPSVISQADVVVVCVPTPLTEEQGPDLSFVLEAARSISKHVSSGTLVVLESTTYPGTTEGIFSQTITKSGWTVGEDIFVAFSPERTNPGDSRFALRNTPKVVGGVTNACSNRAVEFYSMLTEQVVVASRAREAELSKLLENTFRNVNIALVNELVQVCKQLSLDIWEAIDLAETKPFGFMAFRPGPGVGGHCIPVDPQYLAYLAQSEIGKEIRLIKLAQEINADAPHYVVRRLLEIIRPGDTIAGDKSVLLLGVTYKPNVPDQRQSPADIIAAELQRQGVVVAFHDPYIALWQPEGAVKSLKRVSDLSRAAREADVTVLLQPHETYALEEISSNAQIVFDTRGLIAGEHVVRL